MADATTVEVGPADVKNIPEEARPVGAIEAPLLSSIKLASKLVMVSGGFDPVHVGHLRMFDEARSLGDALLVVLNCDEWLMRKKGRVFMTQDERAELIRGFGSVTDTYILVSESNDVCEALEKFKPAIFANGGDRKEDNIPEYEVCKKLGIDMAFNVGGGKIQSSSWLHDNYAKHQAGE